MTALLTYDGKIKVLKGNKNTKFNLPKGEVLLVDDYGHHPREVKAIINAVRDGWEGKRLIMVYQPHRYSRTRDCFEDFVRVLGTVDALALAEVYSAGEVPIVGADSRALARSVRLSEKVEPRFVPEIGDMPQAILDAVQDGDVVMCMGAGSIGAVPGKVVEMLQNNELKAREGSAP